MAGCEEANLQIAFSHHKLYFEGTDICKEDGYKEEIKAEEEEKKNILLTGQLEKGTGIETRA